MGGRCPTGGLRQPVLAGAVVGACPGVPKVEVVGLSREKVEELLWDTITQVRADLAAVPRKWFPLLCNK